jgi:hypothetical protein
MSSASPEWRQTGHHFRIPQRSAAINSMARIVRRPIQFISGPHIRRPRLRGIFLEPCFRGVRIFANTLRCQRRRLPCGYRRKSRLLSSDHGRRPRWPTRCRRNSRCYLILAKHSFRRSSSERTCVSMASCNASAPLLDNSAEAFLSRFCFQSRIACLVALWASDVALRYAFTQVSVIEQVLHS